MSVGIGSGGDGSDNVAPTANNICVDNLYLKQKILRDKLAADTRLQLNREYLRENCNDTGRWLQLQTNDLSGTC